MTEKPLARVEHMGPKKDAPRRHIIHRYICGEDECNWESGWYFRRRTVYRMWFRHMRTAHPSVKPVSDT